MSNGGCDLACKTKIILNGGNAVGVLQSTMRGLEHFFRDGGNLDNAKEIVGMLNDIEDKVVELQKLAAKSVGYTGPVGKMLS